MESVSILSLLSTHWFDINITFKLRFEEVTSFMTPEYGEANVSVDITYTAIADVDVGSPTRTYRFMYRPNPIIDDIEPRTTIVR